MVTQHSLREICYVNTHLSSDTFVGVRANSDGVVVSFPIGYELTSDEDTLRNDVFNLIEILSTFAKEEMVLESQKYSQRKVVHFPIHAYLSVIRDFLRTGTYYTEQDHHYRSDANGKISWLMTLRRQRGFIQKNNSLVFTNVMTKSSSPNEKKEVTQIHKFCVYESFKKIGWLFLSSLPPTPIPQPDLRESLYILKSKLHNTNNDNEQKLFRAMISILEYMDNVSSHNQFNFGTYRFEYVWEKLVDNAFGIKEKDDYFPHSRWFLEYNHTKVQTPLLPDTIMITSQKYYVLDAKYYRYCCSGQSSHLPNSSDINKQTTYGEHLENSFKINHNNIFNCFILPYNKTNNPFNSSNIFYNFGEAVGDWRITQSLNHLKHYERIQGVSIDTRFLMFNYKSLTSTQKMELASTIESRIINSNILP